MKLGYVGLGRMGGALARRLQLQHRLSVYDVSSGAVTRMVEQGSLACGSRRELASECDVVLLCLPTSEHVRTAIFGVDGLIEGLRPGAILIDQTAGDPNVTRAMAADLERQGVALVDAPVSGGVRGAQAGTLAVMVGAASEQFARVQPILASISPNVLHAGDIGCGQAMRLISNLLAAAQRLLTLEAMAVAAKNGVDPKRACDILLTGGGRNAFLERAMASQILQGDLTCGFTLEVVNRHLQLACKLGSDTGVPMLFGNLTREYNQMCISALGRDAQGLEAAIFVDQLSGTQLVPRGVQDRQSA